MEESNSGRSWASDIPPRIIFFHAMTQSKAARTGRADRLLTRIQDIVDGLLELTRLFLSEDSTCFQQMHARFSFNEGL
jgi:hypothetical protein